MENSMTQTHIQRQPQNLYTVLADLQNNHRRYLQVMDDALEIIRDQRPVRGGFRSSLSGYRESITATAAAPTAVGTENDTLSFEFVSIMNPASRHFKQYNCISTTRVARTSNLPNYIGTHRGRYKCNENHAMRTCI
jgi:hypothetical protein